MKMLSSVLLLFWSIYLFAHPHIYMSKTSYKEGESVVVYFSDLPGNANDWIGIYPANSPSNDLEYTEAWAFTNGGVALNEESGFKNGHLSFYNIKSGEYEAKLFLDNSYEEIETIPFKVTKIDNKTALEYKNDIEKETFKNGAVYYPSSLKDNYPKHAIFFLSGWWTRSDRTYETILRFLASKGYIVIFSKENERYDSKTAAENIENLLEKSNIEKYIDKNRLGVVGHSSGGGKAFFVLKYFLNKGWGEDARCVFAMAPWYPFDMRRSDFEKIPPSTKVVIQKYGEDFENDPRISMKIYSMLTTIPNRNKDYQIIEGVDHYFPQGDGNLNEKEAILKPLEALIEYTFNNNEKYYGEALENGSDEPYASFRNLIFPKERYDFPCSPKMENLKRAVEKTGVDYCAN